MHKFLATIESELCTMESVMDSDPTMDACEVLEHREHLRYTIRLLSQAIAHSKLDRRDRRILYMYVLGYPERTIAAKVGIVHQSVHSRIKGMHRKFKGNYHALWEALQPKPSMLEASVPREKIMWCYDSAREAYDKSYWGLSNRKRVWKTSVFCRVPEYL